MTENPYAGQDLAGLLWEAEMVADKYYDGGLILVRTRNGWRAFLGNLKEDFRRNLETVLDKNVPSYEKMALAELDRKPTVVEEFWRLLPDVSQFREDYRPYRFVEDQDDEDQK